MDGLGILIESCPTLGQITYPNLSGFGPQGAEIWPFLARKIDFPKISKYPKVSSGVHNDPIGSPHLPTQFGPIRSNPLEMAEIAPT